MQYDPTEAYTPDPPTSSEIVTAVKVLMRVQALRPITVKQNEHIKTVYGILGKWYDKISNKEIAEESKQKFIDQLTKEV